MKYIYLCLLLVFSLALNAQKAGEKGGDLENDKPTGVEPIDRVDEVAMSLHVNWKMNAPHQVLKKGCLPDDFTISISRDRPFYNYTTEVGRIWIEFEGENIHERNFPFSGTLNFTGRYNDLNLQQFNTPYELRFRVMVEYRILNNRTGTFGPIRTAEVATQNLELLGDGDEYFVEELVGPYITEDYCEYNAVDPDFIVCCDRSPSKLIRLDRVRKRSVQGQISISASISAGGKSGVVNLTLPSMSAGASISLENSIIKTERSDLTIKAEEGECAFPGISLYYNIYTTYIFKVNCESGEDELVRSYDTWRPFKAELVMCTTPVLGACHEIGVTPRTDDGGGRSSKNEVCTGNIFIDSNEEEGDSYEYSWTGPNGFTSFDKDLINVPFGTYTLTVNNSCCDEYVTTAVLCPREDISPWAKNESTGQYCRTITCSGTDCEGLQREECVDPEYGPWEFNESTMLCERDVFINGTLADDRETNLPRYEDEYDEFFEQCIRTYYCEDTPYEVVSPPGYSDWQYDRDECYREVICFGETDFSWENDTRAAIIEWEYSGLGICVGNVYCDEDQFSPIDQRYDDAAYSDWDYSEFNRECIATVSCNDEEIEQESFEREVTSCEFDETFFVCNLEISCGDITSTDSEPVEGRSDHTDDNGIEYCEILCCGDGTGVIMRCSDLAGLKSNAVDPIGKNLKLNNSTTTSIKSFPNPFTNFVQLNNLRVGYQKQIRIINANGQVMVSEKLALNDTDYQMDVAHLTPGVYFLQVQEEGAIVYREKIIKMP